MAIPRVLAASGVFDGVDHERLASNETVQEFVNTKIVLTKEDVPQNFITFIKGWGGECRAEFRLTAKLLSNKRILVTINGKLFEGDSEATTDLAEEKTESVLVPRSKDVGAVSHSMHLSNSGILGGGGDSATISLSFTNSLLEDD